MPPLPKICLDSIAHEIAAIVLVQLKPLPQAPSADSTLTIDIKIEIPDDTVSESFSSDEGEEFKEYYPRKSNSSAGSVKTQKKGRKKRVEAPLGRLSDLTSQEQHELET